MTISELQAMSDQELNALAAKLRGWKLLESDHGSWRGVTGNYYFESEDGEAECSEGDWTPATSRDQSGALLQWAVKRGVRITVQFGSWSGAVNDGNFLRCLIADRYPVRVFNLAENDARAETIAFCAAMLAIQGEADGQKRG